MKVSNENYEKIKTVMSESIKLYNLSEEQFTIGNFFMFQCNASLVSRGDNRIKKWFGGSNLITEEGNFIFNNYELYPNDSNDNHMETVYKKIKKELFY